MRPTAQGKGLAMTRHDPSTCPRIRRRGASRVQPPPTRPNLQVGPLSGCCVNAAGARTSCAVWGALSSLQCLGEGVVRATGGLNPRDAPRSPSKNRFQNPSAAHWYPPPLFHIGIIPTCSTGIMMSVCVIETMLIACALQLMVAQTQIDPCGATSTPHGTDHDDHGFIGTDSAGDMVIRPPKGHDVLIDGQNVLSEIEQASRAAVFQNFHFNVVRHWPLKPGLVDGFLRIDLTALSSEPASPWKNFSDAEVLLDVPTRMCLRLSCVNSFHVPEFTSTWAPSVHIRILVNGRASPVSAYIPFGRSYPIDWPTVVVSDCVDPGPAAIVIQLRMETPGAVVVYRTGGLGENFNNCEITGTSCQACNT